MLEKIDKHKTIIWLFLLASLNLALFAALYGFHPNNDTYSFTEFMRFFRGEHMSFFFFVPARYLNPFYAVVGATIFRFLTAEQSLIVTNILFYYGLVFLTYGLIRRVFKNNFIGFASSLIIMTGYAMVRYGLTQVQDIGGYFWFLLTLYAGWRWWKNKNKAWLYLGGIAVAFGVLTKESGCMGALFVGILFLLDKVSWKDRIFNFLRFSIFPLIVIVVNGIRGTAVGYSSVSWFVFAWKEYAGQNYSLLKWFGVHASTYNVLWIFIGIGVYFLIKNWRVLDRNTKIYLLAVIPSSASYYMWSIFIARTVFISAWFFVPIACYGIYSVYIKGRWYRHLAVIMVILAMVTPYAIQSTLRYGTLWTIMELCNNNPSCTWDYFWKNRTNFSTTGDVLYFKYKL